MKAIITADWHIRSDKPRCRLDDNWEETQSLMVKEIVLIANKYNVPLIINGDLFDSPNIPARFVIMLIRYFSKVKNKVYFLAGNHSLPFHSLKEYKNSSIGIFMSTSEKHLNIQEGMSNFGKWNHFNDAMQGENEEIVFTHRLVFKNTKSIPDNFEGITATQLLEEYPKAKWIFLGDNHKSFHYEKNGRHVINPGCTIRQSVNEKDYQPIVYFVDTEKEIIEEIPLSDTTPMVDDEYIKNANEKEERIESFVEKIKSSENFGLSFKDNVNEAISKNKKTLGKGVIDMIEELMEG
jgi:DNA repair exonuclease SbcCD nuclease subunit